MNKCSICNSNADLHSKLVSSSCNHFICGGCLYKEVIYNHEKLINSSDQEELMELKCIICDKGNFSLNNLELHQILNQRMKYVYIEKKGKSKCEGDCKDESNKNNIVVFCKNCQIFLCVTCFLTHSKDHNFSNNLDQNPNNYCSIHKEENLKIECLTCNIPLCWICRDKSHEGHVTNNITDSHFEKMEKFQSKFTFNDYEKICKTFEYKRDEVIDKLKLESEAQIGKFEKLITEIHDIIFVIQNQINKIRENLEVSVNNLKISFIKYYHDLENTKPDDYLNVFLNGKLLLKKFEINLKEPLHESFNNSYNNIYSKFKRLDEFKNNSNSKNKKSKIIEDDEECEINNSLSQIDDDTDQINNILNKSVKDLPLLKKSKNSRLFKPHDWNDYCYICGASGDMLCCEDCPNVAHLFCAELKNVPEEFRCENCILKLQNKRTVSENNKYTNKRLREIINYDESTNLKESFLVVRKYKNKIKIIHK